MRRQLTKAESQMLIIHIYTDHSKCANIYRVDFCLIKLIIREFWQRITEKYSCQSENRSLNPQFPVPLVFWSSPIRDDCGAVGRAVCNPTVGGSLSSFPWFLATCWSVPRQTLSPKPLVPHRSCLSTRTSPKGFIKYQHIFKTSHTVVLYSISFI